MLLARYEKVQPEAGTSFACRSFRAARFNFSWHLHPEFELTYVKGTPGKRFVGDHIGFYQDEDLVLLGGNLPHAWDTEPQPPRAGGQLAIVIQFLPAFAGSDFLARPELHRINRLLNQASCGLCFTGRARQSAVETMRVMAEQKPLDRLLNLLALLQDLAESSPAEIEPLATSCFPSKLDDASRRRIDTACRIINERYRQPLSLQEVADRLYLTPTACSRFFKRCTGKSFSDYVIALRVGAACERLITTDDTIARIAYDSGFNNLANFNRRFMDLKKMTPREFRHQFSPH